MDPFATLGLPHLLKVGEGDIETVVNGLLKTAHPDAGGDEEEFARIREAGRQLQSPADRIKAAIVLAGGNPSDRGSVMGEVMDFFSPVAEVLDETSGFVQERRKAVSGLGKAILDVRVSALKKKLEALTAGLMDLEKRQLALFEEIDTRGWGNSLEEMGEVFRTLRFLEKWLAQLREATGKIFEALLAG